MYVCVPFACLVPAEPGKEADAVELELQMIVSLCGFCRRNLGSLKERQTLVTTESHLFSSKSGVLNILSAIHG